MPGLPSPRRRKRKWFLLLGVGIGIACFTIGANFVRNEKKIEHPVVSPYGIDDPQFPRSLSVLLGPPLVEGNTVTELLNGDAIFPSMLDAIRGARSTITFESFIYWSGDIGKTFATALAERARAGVKVLILLDWAGSVRMESSLIEELEQAGCQVVRYHAPKWYHLTRLNNRTHRKILVVDGRIGFTGGVGIGDEWTGNAQDPLHWRDTHFKVEGPVVAQMQAVFMVNWIKARSTVEHTSDFFPPLEPVGDQRAQMFHSAPDEGSENIRLMYLLSIASARRTLLLTQAYFVPDDLLIDTMAKAALRGVRIEVIMPGDKTDTPRVRQASRARWAPLLEAGVKIYEYQPTNLHAKVMIVDDLWSSVGSTNFDNRAFRLNDEANLNVYDAAFAARMTHTFEADKLLSREITLADWQGRTRWVKFTDWFWSLFRQQM
ncbi:MAG: cardiolipin synthase [Burkholderiales bacterium]|nr:cardiolipin synthase [Opitutaceae bacterium]